jgi:hypothetical protein
LKPPNERTIHRRRDFDFNTRNPSYPLQMKEGLYANIQKKRARIAAGSGERMRKPGSKGAPTAKAFRDSKKTAKKK